VAADIHRIQSDPGWDGSGASIIREPELEKTPTVHRLLRPQPGSGLQLVLARELVLAASNRRKGRPRLPWARRDKLTGRRCARGLRNWHHGPPWQPLLASLPADFLAAVFLTLLEVVHQFARRLIPLFWILGERFHDQHADARLDLGFNDDGLGGISSAICVARATDPQRQMLCDP